MRTILDHSCHCTGSRVGCKKARVTRATTAVEAAVPVAMITIFAGDTPAATVTPCVTLAGSARSESIAAAETSKAQEHRADHRQRSPARERSCQLSGYCRQRSGDSNHSIVLQLVRFEPRA